MKISILEAKFRRSKLELTRTKLWKSLDLSKQNIILEKINSSLKETPIIISFINDIQWWLMTDQTIYNCNNSLDIIPLNEISKIEISKDVKYLNENYLKIYYNEIILSINLEQKYWIIIIDILKHLTQLDISFDKNNFT